MVARSARSPWSEGAIQVHLDKDILANDAVAAVEAFMSGLGLKR